MLLAALGVAVCLTVLWRGALEAAATDPWLALKQPGHVAFMRHSDAPGGAGDPAGFRLDDCTTQRNLSEEGRAQARRTAAALQGNKVAFDRVLTSPWCRCRETALIVSGQQGEDWDALGNLVGRSESRPSQLAALNAYLSNLEPTARVLLVTHGIVIAALLGISPAQGEIVVVRIGNSAAPAVVARLLVD